MFRKLVEARIWKRIAVERLAEPLHLNVASLFVAVFGSVRAKIFFDLYVRQQHAFGLLNATDEALKYGYRSITAIEFGVASGNGLLNLCALAPHITKATGVSVNIVGFDTGKGMPPLRDYRDHPEAYQPGWYQMGSPDALRSALPKNAELVIGELEDTIPEFLKRLKSPVGFASVDVDYYSSAVSALKAFTASPDHYLPLVTMYFDDVNQAFHNPWCGEMAAIQEFNEASEMRKITSFNFLRESRLFKRAPWISQMYTLHVLDHPGRFAVLKDHPHVDL